MVQLNRYQMAAVKRTAQNTKKLNSDKAKVEEKMQELAGKLVALEEEIKTWEAPIKEKYGCSSAQIIAWGGIIPDAGTQDTPSDVEVSNN